MGVNTAPFFRIIAGAFPLCAALLLSSCDPILDTVSAKTIVISAAGNATSIMTDGGTLQMRIDEIEPASSNSEVSWYVTYETGMAAVSETGLVAALAQGTVEIFASDGEATSNKITLQIGPQTPGWKTYGPPNIQDSNEYGTQIALSADGTAYLAFVDGKYVDGTFCHIPTVQRFDGTVWKTLGKFDAADLISGTACLSLTLAKDGTPYVAFWLPHFYGSDSGDDQGRSITVCRWNGSAWVKVGDTLYADKADNLKLVISSDGTPYLGYSGSTLVVLRLTGSTWQKMWPQVMYTNFESMTVADDGTLYFSTGTSSSSCWVEKYSSGMWTDVGLSVTGSHGGQSSLVCDSGGTPYIAYDGYLKKFDGAVWSLVGTTFDLNASYPSLALAADGTPYVAFRRYSSGLGAAGLNVGRFNGTTWEAVGAADFSPISILDFASCLALRSDAVPFVAFNKRAVEGSNNTQATVMIYR